VECRTLAHWTTGAPDHLTTSNVLMT